MDRYRINGEIVVTNLSREELGHRVAAAAGTIKTMCGIGNNAAWSCCLEVMDKLKEHPNFRQRVKQGFKGAMEEFKAYERNLVYAQHNRLFHLADLTPEYRKRYGDISDREYYEYWCGTGATAYSQNKGWINNLWNKFRMSLIRHKVPNEDVTAWAMTACAMLRLAECIFTNNIGVCVADYDIPRALIEEIFGGLNLKRVADRWDAALTMLEPKTSGYDLDEDESKNIQFGLDQLMEIWTSTGTMHDALAETTEAYSEVFRTKGEQKKALRMIAELGR